jgi:hypothetical protein
MAEEIDTIISNNLNFDSGTNVRIGLHYELTITKLV